MQKPGQKSAIISSTALDLPEHRKEVLEACLAEDVFPQVMESLPARDADAIRVSQEMVDEADIYIGIFAWRYGHIPKGRGISITEIEFNRAVKRKIPILIFLIHKEHSLTIEMVETGDAARKKLAALKERASKGRGRREFKSPADLRAHVIQALSALKRRELGLVSPTDAIRAEQHRLEQLDPRFSVGITATAASMNVQIQTNQTTPEFPIIRFLKEDRAEDLKAFLEKGQSFQVKAANVEMDNCPLHNDILRGLGDAEITFTGLTFKGCLQFHFVSQTEPLCLQMDGEWVVAPKRFAFAGQLSESPLKVSCVSEMGEDGKWKPWVTVFRISWAAWEGQALRALAYFVELDAFFRETKFFVRFYIRGFREWPPQVIGLDEVGQKRAIEGIEWLEKCRRLAESIGANPPFPAANAINTIESNDVRLLVKLIDEGKHEQENAGQTASIATDALSDNKQCPKEIVSLTVTEGFRVLDFLGVKVPIGPLQHTWTGVELVETRPIGDGRVELFFKGCPNSVYQLAWLEFKKHA